jgi:hypothetical protein
MSLEAPQNHFIAGNLIMVRDTRTLDLFEVYLHRVESRILVILGSWWVLEEDPDLALVSPMWRCWVDQIATPRWDAMRRPIVEAIGNTTMMDHSAALACDVVEAYRLHVLGLGPNSESMLEVADPKATRLSRYERPPVI